MPPHNTSFESRKGVVVGFGRSLRFSLGSLKQWLFFPSVFTLSVVSSILGVCSPLGCWIFVFFPEGLMGFISGMVWGVVSFLLLFFALVVAAMNVELTIRLINTMIGSERSF